MFLAEMTWEEVNGLDRDTVVVSPFGAFEQHSLHLPLDTDAIIARELSRRLDAACGGKILVLPTQWLGFSPHHMDFSGTITASANTYIEMGVEILDSIAHAGFRKFLLLNSHGGNTAILEVVLAKFRSRRPDAQAALVTYWKVAALDLAELRESPAGGMGHACELETSLLLAATPYLVRVGKAAVDGVWPESKFLYKDMLVPGSVSVWQSFTQMSEHGGHGDPTTASASKGERFFSAIVTRLKEVVEELTSGRLG